MEPSRLAHTLDLLQQQKVEVPVLFWKQVEQRIEQYSGKELTASYASMFVNDFVKLRHYQPGEAVLARFHKLILERPVYPLEISNLLNGLASLRVDVPSAVLDRLEEQAELRMSGFQPQNLCALLGGFVKLQRTPSDQLMRRLDKQVSNTVHKFEPAFLAPLLSHYAALNHTPALGVLDKVLKRARDAAQAFSPQQLSMVFSALPRMRLPRGRQMEDLLDSLFDQSTRCLEAFTAQGIAHSINSLGKLNYQIPEQWGAAFLNHAADISDTFRPQHVSVLLVRLHRTGLRPTRRFIKAFAPIVNRALPVFSPYEACSATVGLLTIPGFPRELLNKFLRHLEPLLPQLEPRTLTMLLGAVQDSPMAPDAAFNAAVFHQVQAALPESSLPALLDLCFLVTQQGSRPSPLLMDRISTRLEDPSQRLSSAPECRRLLQLSEWLTVAARAQFLIKLKDLLPSVSASDVALFLSSFSHAPSITRECSLDLVDALCYNLASALDRSRFGSRSLTPCDLAMAANGLSHIFHRYHALLPDAIDGYHAILLQRVDDAVLHRFSDLNLKDMGMILFSHVVHSRPSAVPFARAAAAVLEASYRALPEYRFAAHFKALAFIEYRDQQQVASDLAWDLWDENIRLKAHRGYFDFFYLLQAYIYLGRPIPQEVVPHAASLLQLIGFEVRVMGFFDEFMRASSAEGRPSLPRLLSHFTPFIILVFDAASAPIVQQFSKAVTLLLKDLIAEESPQQIVELTPQLVTLFDVLPDERIKYLKKELQLHSEELLQLFDQRLKRELQTESPEA